MNYSEAKEYIKKLRSKAERSLENAPPGKLRLSKVKNYPSFYYVWDAKYGSSGKYLSKKKPSLIKKLAQKEYNLLFMKALDQADSKVDSLKLKYNLSDIEYSSIIYSLQNVYLQLNPSKRGYVHPFVETDSQYTDRWLSQEYDSHTLYANNLSIVTNSGILVRSKSEKIIADKLTELGIPFLYEMPIQMKNGQIFHPDFVLLDITRRRNIYFEHFGMMDSPEYSTNAIKKLLEYENNGIHLGDNLITSFETSTVPLSSTYISQLLSSLHPKHSEDSC